jgi:hypothetical protein
MKYLSVPTKAEQPLKELDLSKKLINADDIPAPLKTNRAKWLQIIKTIPAGKALHLTEEEAEQKAVSIKVMIRDFKMKKLLPDHYRMRQHKDEKQIVHIYIENTRTR